jgi:pyruvate/2-oxoglutarate dehydrogenase complex dihydrolipoamide acyltransferase (E2) component
LLSLLQKLKMGTWRRRSHQTTDVKETNQMADEATEKAAAEQTEANLAAAAAAKAAAAAPPFSSGVPNNPYAYSLFASPNGARDSTLAQAQKLVALFAAAGGYPPALIGVDPLSVVRGQVEAGIIAEADFGKYGVPAGPNAPLNIVVYFTGYDINIGVADYYQLVKEHGGGVAEWVPLSFLAANKE